MDLAPSVAPVSSLPEVPPPLSSSPHAATRTAQASAAHSRNRSLLDTISPSVRWFGLERTRFARGLRGRFPLKHPRDRFVKRRRSDWCVSCAAMSWWREGVLYQIYPRSFADSGGDGIGDLPGITARLDHLEWLGIDGIWLNPTMPSPNHDWGYDVADYCAVHPDLGTLEDLDELVAEAGRRGIRVLLDLVPNHTSDRHAWFQDALGGRDARHRDFYVWADPADGGGPPNNWLSNFSGSAWTFHEPTGQYYLNQFLPSQPDLNWWNEEVREAIDEVLEFWFDRGVAGFRIDVCHAIVKDRELRDDPPPGLDDHPQIVKRGLKQVHSMNRPELHDVLRRWRELVGRRDGDEPVLVGETYVLDLEQLVPFYGLGEDELHLAFNFLFLHADLDPAQMRPIVEGMERMLPQGAWPVWTGSNHDGLRMAT